RDGCLVIEDIGGLGAGMAVHWGDASGRSAGLIDPQQVLARRDLRNRPYLHYLRAARRRPACWTKREEPGLAVRLGREAQRAGGGLGLRERGEGLHAPEERARWQLVYLLLDHGFDDERSRPGRPHRSGLRHGPWRPNPAPTISVMTTANFDRIGHPPWAASNPDRRLCRVGVLPSEVSGER